MPDTLEKDVLSEWIKQKKGIFELPEQTEELKENFHFKKWVEIIKKDSKKWTVFQDALYFKRGEELEQFYFKRDFVEILIKNELIRYKKKTEGKRFRELDPLSIVQLLSYATQTKIEIILKQNPYFEELTESLFEKIIKEGEKNLNLEYSLTEASEKTKISKSALKERLRKHLIKINQRKYHIKEIDLILFQYTHNNYNFFTEKEIKKMFNKENIDFEKLNLFSKKKIFSKNKIIPIYNQIAEKAREKFYELNFYEMDFFESNKKYEIPEDITYAKNCYGKVYGKPTNLTDLEGLLSPIKFKENKYSFSKRIKKRILDNFAKFFGEKEKKLKENTYNYFLKNLREILPKTKRKKEDEEKDEIFYSFNSKTRQLWKIELIGRIIYDFEIKEYEYTKTYQE